MAESVEPTAGGYISGPMTETPEMLIEFAVEAIRLHAGPDVDRTMARATISTWHRRSQLSPQQFVEVLRRFPSAGAK